MTIRFHTAALLGLTLALAACNQKVQTAATPSGGVLSAQAASGEPVINEVYYDGPGTDTDTFTELKGPAGKSLSGYTLTAYNATGSSYASVALTGSIPASGYYVVGQSGAVSGVTQVSASTDLYNTSSSLRLLRSGAVIDAVSYGGPSSNLGEGSSASGVSAGQSLARVPDGQDTGANSADFRAATPTPGSGNGGTGGGTNPGTGSGKTVLFDLTKHEDAGNSDWRVDGAYSDYADALRSLGYTVKALTGSSVTSAALSGAKVLIIPEPQNPFSDTERAALLSFVQNGGGLFMIGDHRSSDRDNDGWDSPEVFNGWDGSTPASVASTLQRSLDSDGVFKLGFSFNSSFSDPVYTATPLTTHPIIAGGSGSSDDVNSAGIYVGTSIDVLGGSALLGAGGKTYLAANTVGSGRVVAWGDSSTFSDGSLSDGSVAQYANWNNLSNANLGRNVVRWLAGDL